MKPNKEGVWEWFGDDGTRRLVCVVDINKKLSEATGNAEPSLRVYWWGGYYSMEDRYESDIPNADHLLKAEWPDRWGKFVAAYDDVAEEDLYLMPTPEQREEIIKACENR